MTDDNINIMSDLPAQVLDAPIALTPAETIRATALAMAIRYHGDTIIKDGAMYQQKKLEGANMEPTSPELVLQFAVEFERYLRGDYAAMVDHLVGGDFENWLREKTNEAIALAMQEEEP